jgi:hypothetical protein
MTEATEYKGSRVVAKPLDASLMDSNWIHDPSGKNSGATPKMVLEISTILMIANNSNFSYTWDWFHWKGYLPSFLCICITSKTEIICNLDINLTMR